MTARLRVDELDQAEYDAHIAGRTLDDIAADRAAVRNGAEVAVLDQTPAVAAHGRSTAVAPTVRRFKSILMPRSGLRGLPVVSPLVAGVMSRPASLVLVGPTGVGKTAVALSMACSVATGTPWLGREVEPAPVLYVVGEGAYGLDARVSAWEHSWGREVRDDELTFAVKPDSLRQLTTWLEMAETARELRAGLVVLDTFSSLAPDADETKDAPLITRWLSNMAAELAVTVMLVHHPGWGDASRVRGGYQLEANVDEVLVLTGEAQSQLVQLKRKKVKDGPSGAVMHLVRKPAFGSVLIEGVTADAVDEPARERVLMRLGDFGDEGGTSRQLADELGVVRSTVTRALQELVKSGDVRSDGSGNRRRYWRAT